MTASERNNVVLNVVKTASGLAPLLGVQQGLFGSIMGAGLAGMQSRNAQAIGLPGSENENALVEALKGGSLLGLTLGAGTLAGGALGGRGGKRLALWLRNQAAKAPTGGSVSSRLLGRNPTLGERYKDAFRSFLKRLELPQVSQVGPISPAVGELVGSFAGGIPGGILAAQGAGLADHFNDRQLAMSEHYHSPWQVALRKLRLADDPNVMLPRPEDFRRLIGQTKEAASHTLGGLLASGVGGATLGGLSGLGISLPIDGYKNIRRSVEEEGSIPGRVGRAGIFTLGDNIRSGALGVFGGAAGGLGGFGATLASIPLMQHFAEPGEAKRVTNAGSSLKSRLLAMAQRLSRSGLRNSGKMLALAPALGAITGTAASRWKSDLMHDARDAMFLQ